MSSRPSPPRWFWIPLRVSLISLLLSMMSFAISLFLGIMGALAWAALRHGHPNMTVVYRQIAPPVAVTVGLVTVIAATVFEIRQYRQARVLAGIERAG